MTLLAAILAAPLAGLLAGGCASAPTPRLARDITLGDFRGEGSDELRRALSPAATGGSGARLALSATTAFDYSSRPGLETATVTNLSHSRWPEGLEGWDQVPKPEPKYRTSEYPLTLIEASLSADWTLTDPQNPSAVAQSGTTRVALKQSGGGFPESQGQGRPAATDRQAALNLLAESLADQIVLLIGPDYAASSLAPGKDALSKQALKLATDGDWDGAAAIWLEILTLNPEYGPALFNLGLHHERRGDLDKAWAFYRLAFLSVQTYPYRLALTRTADALEKLGRLPQAAPPRPF
jgi:hypothetical protein